MDALSHTAYEGKAKHLSLRPDGLVAMRFKDDATAFNGQKHEQFLGKGAINSRISELLFRLLEGRGIKTHHVGRIDAETLLVHRAEMLALESIVRFRVAGSLAKRTGKAEGTVCAPAITELYYKRDDLGDPMINADHVRFLGLATSDELFEVNRISLRAAGALKEIFEQIGLFLWDLKVELGRTGGAIILADEITPDTCRLRDADGTIFDKDRFRRGEGELLAGYRVVLERLEATFGAV